MNWLLSGRLKTEKLVVKITNLPVSLQGLKLVQLSDFHYGNYHLSSRLLTEAIAVTNSLKPDFIFLTGDYVNNTPEPIYQLAEHLQKLNSRYGIYAILGNHDLYHKNSKSKIINALQNVGIQTLWNEIVYPLGSDLQLVGLADLSTREFQPELVMNKIDPKIPCIVLSHNPDTAEYLQSWKVDLQLSGHTHGGQIVIPGLGLAIVYYIKMLHILRKIPTKIRRLLPFLPKHIPILNHWEWSEGLHQIGNNQLYVNRGLGTYFPGRFFCRPEVTFIQLISININ
ncbi:metallophosphoesterase [Anabaena sp. FACHB-1237]|uniref:metallophosphoesterase n=1 Tax=Anabaena sp. FACHB-1237 TaxID=2692769 RepID=UPI001681898B|nr:metallophosphoesterase [Anabaena sp. FACHB-1237]MBD2138490.1 metallophosphoesterase [Anabaena sp. FACHB-1237]